MDFFLRKYLLVKDESTSTQNCHVLNLWFKVQCHQSNLNNNIVYDRLLEEDDFSHTIERTKNVIVASKP